MGERAGMKSAPVKPGSVMVLYEPPVLRALFDFQERYQEALGQDPRSTESLRYYVLCLVDEAMELLHEVPHWKKHRPAPDPSAPVLEIQDPDLLWLAGLLEGEGSFTKAPPSEPSPVLQFTSTDRDIADKVATMFGVTSVARRIRELSRKPAWQVVAKGRKCAALMWRLLPLMGERRQEQIRAALATYIPQKMPLKPQLPLPAVSGEKVAEECADALVFLTNVMVGCGIPPAEFEAAIWRTMEKNGRRLAEGVNKTST